MFQNGTSSRKPSVPRVLVVITDGYAVGPLDEVTNATLDAGINTFSLGLSRSWEGPELLTIAHYKPERVLTSEFTFNLQSEFVYRWTKEICTAHVIPTLGTLTRDSVGPKEIRYLRFSNQERGLILSVNVMRGNVSVFYSLTERNPNAAVNDGQFTEGVQIPGTNDNNAYVYVGVQGTTEDENAFEITSQ
jgi:hypothetical protein